MHWRTLEKILKHSEPPGYRQAKPRKRPLIGPFEGWIERVLTEDFQAMFNLPATSFEAARKVSTAASSLSLVRFDGNDYSVPLCWVHHPIVAKGEHREVALCVQGREVARHRRIWEKEQVCFEPLHYLTLLERKPGAIDYALPLESWDLPECFLDLRRRLEVRHGGQGVREYIGVLRLLEKPTMPQLRQAVDNGLACGAISRDAIAQFLYPQEEVRDQVFNLDGYPHLKRELSRPTNSTASANRFEMKQVSASQLRTLLI